MSMKQQQAVADWERPDSLFFLAGACHILAHVFMESYPSSGFGPFIIAPKKHVWGYHVFVSRNDVAFDARGYCSRAELIATHVDRQHRRDPAWDHRIVALDVPVVTPDFCAKYGHLSFDDYHRNPARRALMYLAAFPSPGTELPGTGGPR
jgi:hypothetical protein